jgi:putative nucleotidyltransferase with HDIG domain
MKRNFEEIFELYEKYGNSGYIGENVSQIEHALQCAHLAEKEGFDRHIILGAFFHDIGHLLGEVNDRSLEKMIRKGLNFGVEKHEKLGADFLREFGLPENVCYCVENHVSAKRYLVYKVFFSKSTLK